MANSDSGLVNEPSRVRYGVLGYLCALAFVLYVDRICIGQAGPSIQRDLELSNFQMSFVYMAFTVAYALFEVPTGRLGDRFGSRKVLIRIVLWWSAFTALTGVVWKWSFDMGFGLFGLPTVLNASLLVLMLIRFLFGAGEAGAMPNIARVLTRWFPRSSRGRAQALITTATLIGGTLAPITAAFLIDAVTWRWAFVLFGLLGVMWAAAFATWFHDDPSRHPHVNPAELRLIRALGNEAAEHHDAIPWGQVFRSPNVWVLGGVTTCTAFLTYLFFTWYPTYLQEGRGVAQADAGGLTGMVLAGGAVGSLAGGFLHDFLLQWTGSRSATRRGIGFVGLVSAAFWVGVSMTFESPVGTSLCFGAASFCTHLTLPCWWMTVIEFTGKHVGALFGLLNSLGAVGATSSQLFMGWFTDYRKEMGFLGREQWDPAFWVYVCVLAVGSIGWLLVDPVKTLDPLPAPPAMPVDELDAV